jgi:hypothetical protein
MEWDAGMLRGAERGGRKAQAVREGSGTSLFSRRTRGAGTGRIRTRGLGTAPLVRSASVGSKAGVWSRRKSPCGGPRAGEIGGGVCGSSRWPWARTRWAREVGGVCFGYGPGDASDGGTEFGVRSQDAVVAVAVDTCTGRVGEACESGGLCGGVKQTV